MSRLLRSCLTVLIPIVLILIAASLWFGRSTVRSSFPRIDGELNLPGLKAPVDIYRDSYGIPHIYASSQRDLFFAQGYVHAQDRFWQMDFWRHLSQGRLAEMFGDGQLETDAFLRTLGWGRVAQQELETMDETTLAILQSYADGVNAYLADHQGSQISLEYAILKLMNSGYKPEPWQPVHSLAWAKVMAWDLGANMDSEIQNAILKATLTPEQYADLHPAYSDESPVIAQEFIKSSSRDVSTAASQIPAGALASMQSALRNIDSLAALLGPTGPGIGSNNWVISGDLTSTGKPLLANDPHLGAQMPSIWYEIDLQCKPKGPDCPYQVAGFSFAGAPGVIIGHNERIAWGFTNVGPDVQDLYIEKINPDNSNQYEVNGQWEDMTLVKESLLVPGKEPQELTVRYTRHGPIISDTYGPLVDFSTKAGIDLPESYAIALRWTALDPGSTFVAIWQFAQAQNWDEFRKAASFFNVPSQNLVYADVDGNIGYQMPGSIPIRASGDGTLPVPGWTDEYEWTGFIPFEDLPNVANPPKGYIATANNAVVGADYPYLISSQWDYGFRAQRIVEMIENASKPIDIPTIQVFQGDDMDMPAQKIVPVLMNVDLGDDKLAEVRSILQNWDYQSRMDSAPAAIYYAFWRNLLAATFQDDLPEDYWPTGGDYWAQVVLNLLDQPNSPWWDDKSTSQVETRDEVFKAAFQKGVEELQGKLGGDPQKWKWGDLHTITFRNGTLGESGIAPIEALFNRGPYNTAGGSDIVNATSWNALEGYDVQWLPSMRMIVDLSDLQNSFTVNTLGESGHAYHPHYTDMVDLWRNIQYHPMQWEPSAVEADAEGHLRLVP